MPKDYQQYKNQTFLYMHCENVTITNAKVNEHDPQRLRKVSNQMNTNPIKLKPDKTKPLPVLSRHDFKPRDVKFSPAQYVSMKWSIYQRQH